MSMPRLSVVLALVLNGCWVWGQEGANPPAEDGPAAPSADELLVEVKDAVIQSLRVFDRDFRATVVSPDISGMLEKEIAKALQSPIPVKVSTIEAVCKGQESALNVSFAGLPPEFQGKVDEVVKNFVLNKAWWQLSRSFMKSAESALESKLDYKVWQNTAKLLDLEIRGVDEPFYNELVLQTARIHVDRLNHVVGAAKLYFSNGKSLVVILSYEPRQIKDVDGTVFVWTGTQVNNDSWLNQVRGLAGWPNKLTVKYTDYRFE